MSEIVCLVASIEEFRALADGTARCWWTVDVLDGRAVQTIYAEAPSREGGFVVFRYKRVLNPRVLRNLERMHGVRFGGGFEERVFNACCFLFTEFLQELKILGVKACRGRYFLGLRPLLV